MFSGCNSGILSREKILVDSSLDKLEVKALSGQLITSSFFPRLRTGRLILGESCIASRCKSVL